MAGEDIEYQPPMRGAVGVVHAGSPLAREGTFSRPHPVIQGRAREGNVAPGTVAVLIIVTQTHGAPQTLKLCSIRNE